MLAPLVVDFQVVVAPLAALLVGLLLLVELLLEEDLLIQGVVHHLQALPQLAELVGPLALYGYRWWRFFLFS